MPEHNDAFDSPALAASALAAVLAVSGQDGRYEVLNLATGVTLFMVVTAFEWVRVRNWVKSVALSLVLGLISWLILGYLAEAIYFKTPSGGQSQVPPIALVAAWIAVALFFTLLDQFWVQRVVRGNGHNRDS